MKNVRRSAFALFTLRVLDSRNILFLVLSLFLFSSPNQLSAQSCNNVNTSGSIGHDQTLCDGASPSEIISLSLPQGGSGAMEYVWLKTSIYPPSTDNPFTSINHNYPSYTPTSPVSGTDTISYRRCARRVGCNNFIGESNWISIYPELNPATCNEPPVAVNDSETGTEDVSITANVGTNDSDPENEPLNYTLISGPTNGTITLNIDGSYTYTPNPDYNGTDAFVYEITDIYGETAQATVTLTLSAVNDAPTASNDNDAINEDTNLYGNVGLNDSDADNDPLSYTVISGPSNGTLVLHNDGSYIYIPNTNYNGSDIFVYLVSDNQGGTAQGSVTLTVNSVNDAPLANNDNDIINEDTSLSGNVSLNDSDVDNDPLSYTLISGPSNGTLTFDIDGSYTYIPNPNFNGSDSFVYEISDNQGGTAQATMILTVNAVNDIPTGIPDINITVINMPVNGNVLTNDLDLVEGDLLTVNTTPVTLPNHGTVSLDSDGSYTYTPVTGYSGVDIFYYEICDNGTPQECTITSTTIEILAPSTENVPPVGNNDVGATQINTTLNGTLLSNDFDPNNGVLFINTTPVTTADNGTVTISPDGSYVYIPNPEFTGVDQFTYLICDNSPSPICDEATVTLYILEATPINIVPLPGDDAVITPEGRPISGSVTVNDLELDGETISVQATPVQAPVNGSVSINVNGTFDYLPNPGYAGPDQFIYTVCDDASPSNCSNATVYITVFPVNNQPVAMDDDNNTLVNVGVSGNVLINDRDSDADGLTLDMNLITQVANGVLNLNPDGSYTYQPSTDFTGQDHFEYQVCDTGIPGPLCNTATVTINVSPLPVMGENNPISANDDESITFVSQLVTGNVLSNDMDPEGDNLILTDMPITPASNGLVSLNTDGTFYYLPFPGFEGRDAFQYQVCDDASTGSTCALAWATIHVVVDADENANDIPFAGDDHGVCEQDAATTGSLLTNDRDLNNNTISINTSPVQQPNNGTVSLFADGSYDYIPNPGFSGPDHFVYQVCDDQTPALCTEACVYLLVYPEQCVDVSVAVYLEGAMTDPGNYYLEEMRTDLFERELLPGMTFTDPLTIGIETPAGHPYGGAPWNYGSESADFGGTEGSNFTNASYSADVVDWVLISLRRDPLSDESTFLRTVGLLHKDGSIAFVDPCVLSTASLDRDDQVWMMIEHRNHIGVLSPIPASIENGAIIYDFRNQDSWRDQPYQTGFGQKLLTVTDTENWAMFAGDGDQFTDVVSWDINGNDKIVWQVDNGIFTSYNITDFSLNGDISGADKILWLGNNGISSRVPK